MPYKTIDVIINSNIKDVLDNILTKKEIVQSWKIENQDKKIKYSLVVEEKNVEMMVDILSKTLHIDKEIENINDIKDTIILTNVEGLLPKLKITEEDQTDNKKSVDRVSVDEIYNDILNGSKLSQNFLLNIILSSIVCTIGIIKKDMGILIVASAIAPFMGSILAYSFSMIIGDKELMKQSSKTMIFGILLSFSIALTIGFLWNYLPNTYRIDEGLDLFQETKFNQYTFVLAIASGMSAGLAITTGLPTIMASFMVSVSLLPNITITGITLSNGFIKIFISSLTLLIMDIICIILSSQLIFLIKKIKPKTKKETEIVKTLNFVNIIYYILILTTIIVIKILVERK